jgi:hypothetical protein
VIVRKGSCRRVVDVGETVIDMIVIVNVGGIGRIADGDDGIVLVRVLQI